MIPKVCAIIVTYHPDEDLAQHITVLLKQVDGLVVVDNLSSEAELVHIRELARQHSFTLLENEDNLGIGTALNRGIQWVASHGAFTHVALFDQDSEIGENFFSSMFTLLANHPTPEKVGIVASRITNKNTGASDGPRRGARGNYLVAQTSGSLMPLEVFRAEGGFKEDLFIDYVDFEYCLRIISDGWLIEYCDAAVLLHVPGDSNSHSLFGFHLGTSLNYSPLRTYYSMRNGAWVMREYWNKQPEWCRGQVIRVLKGRLRVILFEHNRTSKLMASARGLKDGLRGELGKRVFTTGTRAVAK